MWIHGLFSFIFLGVCACVIAPVCCLIIHKMYEYVCFCLSVYVFSYTFTHSDVFLTTYRLEFERKKKKKKKKEFRKRTKRENMLRVLNSVEYIVRSLRAIWNCLDRIFFFSVIHNFTYFTFDTWADCDVVIYTFFLVSNIHWFCVVSLFDFWYFRNYVNYITWKRL